MKQTPTKIIRKVVGKVVSDKMDKTRVIEITEKRTHKLYGKIYLVNRKIMAHDANNEYHLGDEVEISETKPYSKNKSWTIIRKTNVLKENK